MFPSCSLSLLSVSSHLASPVCLFTFGLCHFTRCQSVICYFLFYFGGLQSHPSHVSVITDSCVPTCFLFHGFLHVYILAVSPCSLLDHLSLSLLKRPLVFLSSSLAGLSQFAGISCLVSVVYCFLVTPFGLLCFSDFLKQTTQQFNSTCLCVPAFWSST